MVEFLLVVIAVLLVVLIFRTNKLLEKNLWSEIADVRKGITEAAVHLADHLHTAKPLDKLSEQNLNQTRYLNIISETLSRIERDIGQRLYVDRVGGDPNDPVPEKSKP